MKKLEHWFNTKFGWFLTNGRKQPIVVEESYIKEDDMKTVSEALKHAKQYSLDTEIVATALLHMKDNPTLTISEAITLGYFDWVK